MSTESDRDFRDFRRYTGDGKPNAPLDAPLPIGNPASGVHNITKSAMRARFNDVDAAVAAAQAAQSTAEGLLGDAISSTAVPVFSTVTAVQSYDVPTGMDTIYITGRTTSGSGGTYFKRVVSSTHPGKFSDGGTPAAVWEPTLDPANTSILEGTSSIVVGVGTTGDFADLPTALLKMMPYSATNGRIELRLVSPITLGLLVNDLDARKFVITSDIGIVPLDAGFDGVGDASVAGGIDVPANNRLNNLIAGFSAGMPALGCVIDMAHAGDSGYYGIWNSTGLIYPDCGVINAGYNNLEWRNGHVSAYGAVLTGANQCGIRTAYCATVAAQEANCDNCMQDVDASGPTTGAIDVSRTSTLHFRGGSAQNSGGAGMNVRRTGRCTFEEANFSNASSYGIYWHGASIGSGYSVIVNNTRNLNGFGYGIWIRNGSIDIVGAQVKNSAGALDIRIGDSSPFHSGGVINMTNVETTNGTNVVTNVNVDSFNVPNRYGIAWNAAIPGSLHYIGKFSGTGVTRGKAFSDDNTLESSINTSANGIHIGLYNPTGYCGGLGTEASGSFLDTTSDARLKINHRPLHEELDVEGILDAIEAIGFDWLSAVTMHPTGQRGHGFLAQAVYEVYPPAVSVGTGKPGDKNFVPWAIHMSALIPLLMASRRNMRAEIRGIFELLNGVDHG